MNLVTWFARNSVAANMLMVIIVVGGLLSLSQIRKQVFPEYSREQIEISVAYPGASPTEIEMAICAPIEEQVRGLGEIRRVNSVATQSRGTVILELLAGTETSRLLDEVKTKVDLIETFPDEAEPPRIRELITRSLILRLALSGPSDPMTLRHLGEKVRDDIAAIPGVTSVEFLGIRPYEISVEVSEQALNRHHLTLDQVAEAVRRSSLDLPGGTIRSQSGEISLRTANQARHRTEFEALTLLTRPDGTRLRLGEVAAIRDGLAETGTAYYLDGAPAVLIDVLRVGNQDMVEISEKVRAHLQTARQSLPEGISLTVWEDRTEVLKSRIETLLRNGRDGLVLVILTLGFFLRLRLAIWVTLSIPVSILGALWIMPYLDMPLTILTLLAFLLVLGIVVDDAIVVGENIYRHHEMGSSDSQAAAEGVSEVGRSVFFSVLTTIAAFAPLTLLPGKLGKFMAAVPVVAICVLVFSLVESLLILPAHLTHLPPPRSRKGLGKYWERLQIRGLEVFDQIFLRSYRVTLRWALSWRATTLALAVAALSLTVGLVAGGRLPFSFFPSVDDEQLTASLTLPPGTPTDTTVQSLRLLEASAHKLARELAQEGEPNAFRHIIRSTGSFPSSDGVDTAIEASHLGQVKIKLGLSGERNITSRDLTHRWRMLTEPIPDAERLAFDSVFISLGKPIDVRLTAKNLEDLQAAARDLKNTLNQYPGVFDIADTMKFGKPEARITLTPEAESLGFTNAGVARQIRQAFHGEEIQNVQRGSDAVKVLVRYPRHERASLGYLENMHIRSSNGDAVPFTSIGHIRMDRSLSAIDRTDGRRTVHVIADMAEDQMTNKIVADLRRSVLPELARRFPGLDYSFAGNQEDLRETTASFLQSFLLALFLIYALLAIFFKSYLQPLLVMSAVPLGIIGAIAGHFLTGYDLTLWSCYGILALTGVVVNDSLVLVDFINRSRRSGTPLEIAIREAGEKRFRPILLTSLTTFAGLVPLLLETSWQAQFLIPVAVSLAFGVLFSTVGVLVVVPVGYSLSESDPVSGDSS